MTAKTSAGKRFWRMKSPLTVLYPWSHLNDENRIPDLIMRAYDHKNAALSPGEGEPGSRRLMEGSPCCFESAVDEALEAIGGMGDSLTGIVSHPVSGMEVLEVRIPATRVNRIAEHYACPTPASQVMEMTAYISRAMEDVLKISGRRHEPRYL